MKFAAFLVLALSAVAVASPAFTNKNNQIQQQQQQDAYYNNKQQQQQQQYMTEGAKGPAIDILKQWCFSSQMSQQELTASFKKLVQEIKANPADQTTEAAVMGERICQGATKSSTQQQQQQQAQKQQTGDESYSQQQQQQADAKSHELIKDVYMDALISANSRECTQQLLKIVQSQKVDAIRASYYMTRIAVSDKQSIKDAQEIEQFAKSFVDEDNQEQQQQQQSEAIERQKLFATTALIGKWIAQKPQERQQIAQVAQEVAKTIVERYIKPVSQQEVEQYKQAGQQQQQQQSQEASQQLAKKIAKRNAALKALANIPGHVLKQCQEAEQQLTQLAQNKQELSTVRQSAIECLEQNDKQMQLLKQLTFDQEEPIEVRVAAYRALMTTAYSADSSKQQQQQQQQAKEIVQEIVKHCEQQQNQQQDDQFVLYAISHLDNIRTSQQPEHQAIKETIQANKQHYMQIQVLAKKFKQQLGDVRQSSRNYKLAQEFNQLESGFVLEGDLIYESKQKKEQHQILPKLVRVNMSMPIMGETVNVVEITLRQNQMDEEILGALKMFQSAKFGSQSVARMVDSFKSTVERQQQQQQQQQQNQQNQQQQNQNQKQVEADLTIKVDGCTIVYLSVDDFKSGHKQQQHQQHQRNTRSVHYGASIVDEIVEYLKREPIAFNRGFNVNINERLAKVLDVDANILAGLRFESRAQGHGKEDFEVVAQMEPRFSFEVVVGPAKMTSKKLLQRFSTKTALGFRLRFKKDQLVDVQLELPANTMELFTVETQLVERSQKNSWSYNYLPESIYGQEDIYSNTNTNANANYNDYYGQRKQLSKRSIASAFGAKKSFVGSIGELFQGKTMQHTFETSPKMARATGLNAKLRLAASPKDMSLFASATIEKEDPSMQGYRVKVEKQGGRTSADQQTYMMTLSTPGSRQERTMQMRLTTQAGQQRSLVKAEIQSARTAAAFVAELVHDGRQYSIKSELASRTKQWRHAAEFGLIQQSTGRLSTGFSYKPYVQIDSTAMKRPVQLQGQVAYTQSPKSVISYELKCPTSGDFVQGKLIFDARDASPMAMQMRKRQQTSYRRSMQSPIEMIVSKDVTLTNEFIAQVQKRAVKVHNMLEWDAQKYALQGDSHVTYKDMRKQQEQQVSASMKVEAEQQQFSVERKDSQDERKQFAARLVSKVRPSGHQMEAECRYNGRRQSVVAYKHKVEVQEIAKDKFDATVEVELVDSERQISEKASGRARATLERKMKQLQGELSWPSRRAQVKLNAEYQSKQQHALQLQIQAPAFAHKCELRNSQRQFSVQSRTEKPATGQVYYKMQVEAQKQWPAECRAVVEVPAKRVALAADLKLAAGKRSSLAIQGGRFASQVEFSFDEPSAVGASNKYAAKFSPLAANFRLRSNLKDLINKQAYWMDSQLNAATFDKDASFVRFDSPYYRTDIEFDPRQQETKFAAFARAQPADSYNSIYASPMIESLISQAGDKLQLGSGKLWALRAIASTASGRDALKQMARRALFEYADRRQAHKHAFNWAPAEERLSMDMSREPSQEFGQTAAAGAAFAPIRMRADVSTRFSRPSTASLESDWMSAELETKPFVDETDEQDAATGARYAKISALSRHRRSVFKKHESELHYNKHDGYKAHMKHQDAKDKRHELRAEAAASPKSWARLAYESEKHGKASWEHKWRQQQKKRQADNEQVYASEFGLRAEGPAHNKWTHASSLKVEEPARMVAQSRQRRSVTGFFAGSNEAANKFAFDFDAAMDYLKHTSARLTSKQLEAGASADSDKYELDFDYQPQKNYAALNMDMPGDMQHASTVEIKPAERLYKIQSRLYNRRTAQPTYELLAATKPYAGEQAPVFVHSTHPMLERAIDEASLGYKLFKQPLKLDYSDKHGRAASFDYDHMPETAAAAAAARHIAAGLRQKRAAAFYKAGDFQHSASYDFYPEALLAKAKPSFYAATSGQMMPVAIKTNTKYGPVVVRADSDAQTAVLELESPLISAKLASETAGANMRQLYTVQIDNKQQRVQLSKLVRDYAPQIVRDSKAVKQFARAYDGARFEQQAELLASVVEQIFKIKAQTKQDGRTELAIEAEWNKEADKAYAKINGERVNGHAVVDLVRKSAELKLEAEAKHGQSYTHTSRLVQVSDKFYELESMTARAGKPVFKLQGRVSAKVFEPEHLFARRRQSSRASHADHQSSFEATIYEPKQIHVSGQFDCENKEARVVFHDIADKKTQETKVRFDDDAQTFLVAAQLNSQRQGQIYAATAKINLPGLFQTAECMRYAASCKSEIAFVGNQSQKSQGAYTAQYYPGELVAVSSPYGKTSYSLAY